MPNSATCQIVGHLGRDPETRAGAKTSVTKFGVAVSDGYGDNKTTSWYDVAIFGALGERAAQWLRKGSTVLVCGRMSIRTWEKDGKNGTQVEIVAQSFENLTPKDKRDSAPKPQEANRQEPAQGGFDDLPF